MNGASYPNSPLPENSAADPRTTYPTQHGMALTHLRLSLTRNILRNILQESRLRVIVIIACSLFFWFSLYGFFHKGFEFIFTYDIFSTAIVEYAFSMYFLTLLMMLLFSVGIIMYNGLFGSRECEFLLTLPMSEDRIFAYKFFEAMAFACWGFILIGSPLLLAYGVTAGAPWPYYFLFLLYMFAFVILPGSLGAALALLVGYFLPRRQKTVLGLAGLGVFLLVGWVLMNALRTPGSTFTEDWINGLMGRLAFSQDPFWPSVWITRGLIGSAQGNQEIAGYYFFVTATNALVMYLIAALLSRDLYRRAYSRVQGGRSARRMWGFYQFDRVFHRVFSRISPQIRVLILKDLRIFRRDPAQWSQFLILFALLGFYFLTIRKLGHDAQSPSWRNLLSFLNLAVTALLLSTFTSRFVFPLLSLEGRNFWILGLFPLRREAILWGKFAFAAGTSLSATVFLVIMGDVLLGMDWTMIVLHVGMILIICLGLAGISVGLGARFPNLRETDPSKIAAGFGGTLNLLLSLVFILIVVMAMALPCHMYFVQRDIAAGTTLWKDPSFQFRIGLASIACLIAGASATIIPMRLGMRAFRDMEL